MEGERDVAPGASRHPATDVALHHRCKAATVLEEDDLLPAVERLAHQSQQTRTEGATHEFLATLLGNVHHLNLGQTHIAVTCLQRDKSVLAGQGIMIALQAWSGGTQQRVGATLASQH